jgi:hypothetical protein
VQWGTQGDVAYVPKMRTQMVAARTVAETVADLAVDRSYAPWPTLGVAGPREESLVEMAKLLVSRRGDTLRVEAVSDPVDGEANESGILLPGPARSSAVQRSRSGWTQPTAESHTSNWEASQPELAMGRE